MSQPIDRLTVAIETGTLTPMQRLRLASLLDVIDVHAENQQDIDMQAAYWRETARRYQLLLDAEYQRIGGESR